MTHKKKQRRAAFNARIAASYHLHNDDDVSTERLLAMVCSDCGCEVDRVIEGMVELGLFEKVNAISGESK